jgi:hypothetical protein
MRAVRLLAITSTLALAAACSHDPLNVLPGIALEAAGASSEVDVADVPIPGVHPSPPPEMGIGGVLHSGVGWGGSGNRTE